MLWSFRSATRLVWDIQIVADLTLCQALILAAATGGFVLGMDCNQGRMAQRRHGARRVTAQGPTFGLRRLPASATELDSRFDFFTPTAGHLGRAVAKRWTADEVVRLGQTATEAELIEIRGPALVPSDQLASLKETLISANGLAATWAITGEPTTATISPVYQLVAIASWAAARDTSPAQTARFSRDSTPSLAFPHATPGRQRRPSWPGASRPPRPACLTVAAPAASAGLHLQGHRHWPGREQRLCRNSIAAPARTPQVRAGCWWPLSTTPSASLI